MNNKLFWWLAAAFVIFRIVLVGWWPFLAHTDPPDDAAHGLEQAMAMLDGDWLGPFTHTTLVRGPSTPLWIASMHFIGIPLLLSQFVLYASVCVITMLASARLTESKGHQLCVFVMLLFNPWSLGYSMAASAAPEVLDQSLILGILGVSIIMFVDFSRQGRVRSVHCFMLGVFVFLFWHNGEMRAWIIPYLCLLLLAIVARARLHRRAGNTGSFSGLVSIALIPLSVWLAGTVAVSWKNAEEYGVFAVTETSTAQFDKAIDWVMAVDAEPPEVTRIILSLPSASGLTGKADALQAHGPPSRTAIRQWLRSTVSRAGYYDEGAPAVLEFYDRLGNEIENACADGTLECKPSWLRSIRPAGRQGYDPLLSALGDVFGEILEISVPNSIEVSYSDGSPVSLLGVARLVNSPIRADEKLEYHVPDFFKRTLKNKTRYLLKLLAIYRSLAPALFLIAVCGLFFRMYILRNSGSWTQLDTIYAGLAGTVLLQLVTFAAARAAGDATSASSLALFYPVFYLFTLTGLLSIARAIREARGRG